MAPREAQRILPSGPPTRACVCRMASFHADKSTWQNPDTVVIRKTFEEIGVHSATIERVHSITKEFDEHLPKEADDRDVAENVGVTHEQTNRFILVNHIFPPTEKLLEVPSERPDSPDRTHHRGGHHHA